QDQVIALTKKPITAVPPTIAPPAPSPQTVIQREVHGRVTDSLGAPIAGVSVLIKGKPIGTSTDDQGRYQIPVVDGQVLEFRMVGYLIQEVAVGDQTVIN